ncbi:MAG: SURF1 family protein [Candidatus Thiodiazotropha sp. (ex. Lucinisca nassula)]|nr:SURF1 family protein [Candidatus Thiodiazotropha sp. (ex. Lucinisca nassula)]MBW9262562.1 SURF1 family protein [Candidatus Thiodiazotropha sp. (ex. Lucinisca nassula)]MBW9269325.1 SURF1 family protein [Candidatus Thiodiazotropha sp. (ex. Lucinisca nassula)]
MVIVTPLLCSLGFWQLERAEQKRNQATALEMRRKMPPISLTDSVRPQADQLLYRQVKLQGEFLTERTIFITNRKHLGKTGIHVVTPLQLSESGELVLVNRGWTAAMPATDNESLPNSSGQLSISGEITIPQAPAIELTPIDDNSQLPPHWPYLTLERYRQWSGLEVLPILVLQTSEDDQNFIRQWPTPKVSDLMHIGYAIQWFAFAIIALLVWLRLSYQKVSNETA